MTYLIFKKSDREIRERASQEAPSRYRGITGYARDVEEAEQIQRGRGMDNPNTGLILCDDGGKADAELKARAKGTTE